VIDRYQKLARTRPASFCLAVGLALITGMFLFEYTHEYARVLTRAQFAGAISYLADWNALIHDFHRHRWYEAMCWTIMGIGAGFIGAAIWFAAQNRRTRFRPEAKSPGR
jgi:hypothetical protein